MPHPNCTIVLLSLAAALAISACSNGIQYTHSWSHSGTDQTFDIPQPTLNQARRMARSGNVYCDDLNSNDCSPSVGLLASVRGHTVRQCTVFLVANQYAMTNSHCIPRDLKAAGSNCQGRIWVYFPESQSYGETRIGCRSVVAASPIPPGETTPISPDYALIKLARPTQRPPLSVSRDGLKNQTNYMMIDVDPIDRSHVSGIVRTRTCRAIHDSIVIPTAVGDHSANLPLANCHPVEGNSGSPIIDSAGQVVAVLQAEFTPRDIQPILNNSHFPFLNGSPSHFVVSTNLSCLTIPFVPLTHAIPPDCAASSQEIRRKLTMSFFRKVQASYREPMKLMSADLNKDFAWTVIRDPGDGGSSRIRSAKENKSLPVPYCIRNVRALLTNHKDRLGKFDSIASIKMLAPMLISKIGLNKYLVKFNQVSLLPNAARIILRYYPASLAGSGFSRVTESKIDKFGNSTEVFAQTLSQCSGIRNHRLQRAMK